jgi:zinc/manganese transport system permease protein
MSPFETRLLIGALLLIVSILASKASSRLGVHVIRRGVIFVDIALAQIAALGMTVAFFLGHEPESQTAYLFGLAFTCLGAVFFAYFRHNRIPQEAIIGVSFAVSSAMAILIADRTPLGSEHLKLILSGNVLWVGWLQLAKTAAIYAALGVFHYAMREKFLRISEDYEGAKAQGIRVWLWDLLFYLSFDLVITSSVQIGGILLVFSYLIVPALCGLLFFASVRNALILGWLVGVTASVFGLAVSFHWDLPSGPTIVAAFGLALFLCLGIRRFISK